MARKITTEPVRWTSRRARRRSTRPRVRGYVQYSGTYEIDGDMVHHHVEQSLFPNWNATVQSRHFELADGRLTLRTPPVVFAGTTIIGVLTWAPR